MAKQELHDIREYYIVATEMDPDPAGAMIIIPIPFSAQVIRMTSAGTGVSTNTQIRLQRDGVNLQSDGFAAPLILVGTDPSGTIQTAEYSPMDPQNGLSEGQDGDAIGDLSTLEIDSTGQTTSGRWTFVITLRT